MRIVPSSLRLAGGRLIAALALLAMLVGAQPALPRLDLSAPATANGGGDERWLAERDQSHPAKLEVAVGAPRFEAGAAPAPTSPTPPTVLAASVALGPLPSYLATAPPVVVSAPSIAAHHLRPSPTGPPSQA